MTFKPHSIASAPELVKTLSANVLLHSSLANISWLLFLYKFDVCHSILDCLFNIFTNCGWQCPNELTAIPPAKSKYFFPDVVYK